MKIKACKILTFISLIFSANYSYSAVLTNKILAPQPAPSCVVASFKSVTTSGWASESLKILNNCANPVDFKNSTITFTNKTALNTGFWGSFSPLSYPAGLLKITSQPNTTSGYTASVNLTFPTDSWAVTKLPPGQSFTIQYGESAIGYVASSVQVWLSGPPIATGQIDLNNQSVKPANISATYATINVVTGGQTTKVQLPWQGQIQMTGLATGSYSLQPENITDVLGNVYQGSAVPSSVNLTANQKVSSTITYAPVTTFGAINVQVPSLPAALSGYTANPAVTLKRNDTGASLTQALTWNSINKINQLANNVSYVLTTPMISYNGNNCSGGFTHNPVVSNATTPVTTTLSYNCVQIAQDKVTLNLTGLPATVSSMTVTLTPNNGSAPINQVISVSGGTGTAVVNLADGVVYNVSVSAVSGYTVTFSAQPLTAKASATETISWQQQISTGGRIMTYVTGWKTPPAATDLAAAGYTNVLVAFGVFSTSSPGQIVSAFDTVTASYISQLQAAGIKVSLSLGGASSSIAGTTVDFDQALKLAISPASFQQVFVSSVESLIKQYNFDGIDIDIEYGLNPAGTFTNPTGDILVLANIINQLHSNNPNLLISLTPQTANTSATRAFSGQWANYSSLIMQTHNALSWVGVQLYNTGCMNGIDGVCYDPNKTSNPNFAVAMAVDLLVDWPGKFSSGAATGFLPYIGYLTPSQVVIGFPAPNASGASDGAPVTPVSTIIKAVNCLQTGASCGTYVPSKTFPGFGGVFNWEATYDQNNNYAFAKGLVPCVKKGICQ